MTDRREQRNFLQAFHELMILRDKYQPQRILLGVLGDDRIKGLMKVLLEMRDRSTQPYKAVQLLSDFTLLYEGVQIMQDVLSTNTDFAMVFHKMTEWLSWISNAKVPLRAFRHVVNTAEFRDIEA